MEIKYLSTKPEGITANWCIEMTEKDFPLTLEQIQTLRGLAARGATMKRNGIDIVVIKIKGKVIKLKLENNDSLMLKNINQSAA